MYEYVYEYGCIRQSYSHSLSLQSDIFKARLLVVDDQESDISLLQNMLHGAGYVSVATTSDPHEVCEMHRKNRFDLILLDLQMPGLDGFQVMECLKEIETGSYLPVLVIRDLTQALDDVKVLRGILPICSYCKKIRDDKDYWQSVEGYISKRSDVQFSHSVCPECFEKHVKPELDALERPEHPGGQLNEAPQRA